MYSITRRLVSVVLLSELLLTITVTAVNLGYERSQRYKAFDVMLRGRANLLLAAVEVDESTEQPVLNSKAVELPAMDVYEVRTDAGADLGHSMLGQRVSLPEKMPWDVVGKSKIGHVPYRNIAIHGTRTIDPDSAKPTQQIGVSVFYASPTTPIHEALMHAATFFTIANSVVLLLSALIASIYIRRGMDPLQQLAVAAGSISTRSWTFHTPSSARSASELAALAKALESTVSRLEISFRQQQTFIHDAAHELKTAVTVIKSSLQLLIYKPRTEAEYRHGVELSLTDCGRMEELVQTMLTLALLEQNTNSRDTFLDEPLDAGDAIRHAIEQIVPMAELRGVNIAYSLDSTLKCSMMAEDWISLVSNLVVNAVQHSHSQSTVRVAAQTHAERITLTVQDWGTGIPHASLPFVFDRFYRGDPSRDRSTGGTGLGLAICKAIVHRYGGDITIASNVGEGTIVSVFLPATSNLKPSQEQYIDR